MEQINLFENCIKNYAMPVWIDKINQYYPKIEAKKFIEKINNGLIYNPNYTYVTMVDNLSFLDLFSSGKSNIAKKDLTDRLSEKAPYFEDILDSHEMLLHSKFSNDILPVFKSVMSPHSEAKDLLKYLSRFDIQKKEEA